jgi:hypothetical protein
MPRRVHVGGRLAHVTNHLRAAPKPVPASGSPVPQGRKHQQATGTLSQSHPIGVLLHADPAKSTWWPSLPTEVSVGIAGRALRVPVAVGRETR